MATLLFALVLLAPGDPVSVLSGDFQTLETRQAEIARLQLDRSPGSQYVSWLAGLARGDLGQSIQFREPVFKVISERLPLTLALVLPAIALSSAMGIGLALHFAKKPGEITDRFANLTILILFAVPVYWVAHVLIALFSLYLGWLPVQGLRDLHSPPLDGLEKAFQTVRHLALPIGAIVTQQVALVWLVVREGLIQNKSKAHFMTAMAKGLDVGVALRRHALPQATLSLLTIIGIRIAGLLTAATLIETVFGLPGVGRLLVTASMSRDYPLVMGIILVSVVLTLLANALTDLLYGYFDPRIRSVQ